MKAVLLTSNSIRHKFVANTLAKNLDDLLVISECKQGDFIEPSTTGQSDVLRKHFQQRYETEKIFFPGNDEFKAKTVPILYGELSSPYIYDVIKKFSPDIAFVFGSSIIKKPLLFLLPVGSSINLHLGLSPYYKGSGTNFWPFVNEELEYVGSTLLHIDAEIDTGDIIAHVRPKIEIGDNVHTIGCKVIKDSAACLINILKIVSKGKKLNRVKQWQISNERYYRTKDFNEEVLKNYQQKLENGLIQKYISGPQKSLKLISL